MTPALVKLRPIVHATPTASGLHVRGWASSFTLDGGSGLWTMWERIAPRLAEGMPMSEFAVPAGAPPAVAAALDLLITQLREHDMVVEVPADWGGDAPPTEIAEWLESVAGDPITAWQRLRAARITITGGGAIAAAALRALTAAGLSVAGTVPGAGLLLTAGEQSVAAVVSAEVGFVLPVGFPAEAGAVARRLGLELDDPAVPEVLAALVGSAAAHRLVCTIGGLPDPATEFAQLSEQPTPEHTGPQVLVAHLDPLSANYHPLLPQGRPLPPPADPARTVELLVDPELGPIAMPEFGDLPQLPANIAICGDILLGIGTTAEGARLDTVRAAVQAELPADVIAGIGPTHALGLALRVSAYATAQSRTPVAERDWAADPTARRWWKALTLRCAVPATVEVSSLAPAIVLAEIHADGAVLGWSIEGTAADAVSFAALAATGVAQAREAGIPIDAGTPHLLCGAAPMSAPTTQPPAPWLTRDWHWPADLAERESDFQTRLAELLSVAGQPKSVSVGCALDSAGVVAFEVGIDHA